MTELNPKRNTWQKMTELKWNVTNDTKKNGLNSQLKGKDCQQHKKNNIQLYAFYKRHTVNIKIGSEQREGKNTW